MEFQEILNKRKSVRTFLDKGVPRQLIEKVIEAGISAPSPCNQQLWHFVIIDDPQLKEELVQKACSSTLILRAPVVIVNLYDKWNKKEAIQSGSLAIMNMLNQAHNLELGACAMNSYGSAKQIKRILDIPDHFEIISFLVLGFPDEGAKQSLPISRRPVNDTISYNTYRRELDYVKSYDPQKWSKQALNDYQEYFCRKTILGKTMDLYATYEEGLLKRELKEFATEKVLDLFSYDGGYLRYFSAKEIVSVNFNEITCAYAKEALEKYNTDAAFESILFEDLNGHSEDLKSVKKITLLFKAERISNEILTETLEILDKAVSQDAEILLISRKRNIFLSAFFWALRMKFGDDVRKTGLFAFWGPYKPINVKNVVRNFSSKNWQVSKKAEYFFLPAFFEQILQSVIQFLKSEKTSYLNRQRHTNIWTKILDAILKIQSYKKAVFGSCVVIKFRKG